MQTVYLVDDDDGVRRAISRLLRDGGYEVVAFESAETFLARPDPGRRACLVLDVSMPGLDGLALQGQLNATQPPWPIVFLTGYGDIPMSVRAIKGGAVDFLTKPVAAQVLLDAVASAIERDGQAGRLDEMKAEISLRLSSLTLREREVLAGLASGKLNKQIAADLGVVEQTVKFHRARIMERMRARTVAQLMHMTAQIGFGTDSLAS